MPAPRQTIGSPVGNLRLLEEVFGARTPYRFLRHHTYVVHGTSRERDLVREEYGVRRTERHLPARYAPSIAEGLLGHAAFALKHEVAHLGVLAAAFASLGPEEVGAFVASSPTGAYSRRIGFLYELLTGRDLSQFLRKVTIGGNYVPVLDASKVVTGAERRDTRWRVLNNLPGSGTYAPLIERTREVQDFLRHDWKADVTSAISTGDGDAGLLHRVLNYLYLKETRSSFAIERETPSEARAARFVESLRQAGRGSSADALSEENLSKLQNLIVEPRYAEKGFRGIQNYVSETVRWSQLVHYVPPPPALNRELMSGLAEAAAILEHEPLAQAATASFGFVFHHPFEDGNGRLHRYLLHDFMTRRNLIPGGLALPVSAAILADMRAYDQALEAYSKPVSEVVEYQMDNHGRMTVTNADEVSWLWRYPDLTPQIEFLGKVLPRAVHLVAEEISFLSKYDRLLEQAREIIDMPDRRLADLLTHLHGNGGRLSNNKRKQKFAEMKDEEIAAIESVYATIFGPESRTDAASDSSCFRQHTIGLIEEEGRSGDTRATDKSV